jgi:hypothetical protein
MSLEAWRRVRLLLALALFGTGCADNSLEKIREVTYPPDFHYITSSEIHTTMGALASQVSLLEAIMWQADGPQFEDRAQVVEILSEMRTLALQLKKRGHSNHARIHDEAPHLKRDIERALRSAKMDPPNYYYAGLVSGACSYCHAPTTRSDLLGLRTVAQSTMAGR